VLPTDNCDLSFYQKVLDVYRRACQPDDRTHLPRGWRWSMFVLMTGFVLYTLRILVLPWEYAVHLPGLSPVWSQSAGWALSTTRTWAICIHVTSGALMLVVGFVQFDVVVRTRFKVLHRISGTLYISSGTVCMVSLYGIADVMGASEAAPTSVYVQAVVALTAAAWAACVVAAVVAIRQGRWDTHRVWMSRSYVIACAPISQRVWEVLLMPLALAHALLAGGGVHATWPGHTSTPDQQIVVLSPNGLGVAELAVFPLSACLALCSSLVGGELFARHTGSCTLLPLHHMATLQDWAISRYDGTPTLCRIPLVVVAVASTGIGSLVAIVAVSVLSVAVNLYVLALTALLFCVGRSVHNGLDYMNSL
jgi:hypothetical protein